MQYKRVLALNAGDKLTRNGKQIPIKSICYCEPLELICGPLLKAAVAVRITLGDGFVFLMHPAEFLLVG